LGRFPAEGMAALYPLAFSYGPEWAVETGANHLDIIHKGNPAGPQSEWWGPGISFVDGALVHDPVDVISDQPASAAKADFISWPDDFLGYVASLPGVEVIEGPEPVTIGGIEGSRIIVKTPPMHPLVWLEGDQTWLGGGASGVDPELKRQMILLEVNGEKILLHFEDSANRFDNNYPLVQEIFDSITFGK
jgi:hypothetical protein